MKPSSILWHGVISGTLLVGFPGGPARAQDFAAQPWHWRFQPKAHSRWEMTVLRRFKDVTTKHRLRVTYGRRDIKAVPVNPLYLDQFTTRINFEVEALSSDASGSQLMWTFRDGAVTVSNDGTEVSVGKKVGMPPVSQATQKLRKQLVQAGRRFSKSLAGASFSVAFRTDGTVSRVGGRDGWIKRFRIATHQADDDQFLSRLNDSIFKPMQIEDWMEDWAGGLPETAVSPGENWTFNAKLLDWNYIPATTEVSRAVAAVKSGYIAVLETAPFTVSLRQTEPDPSLPQYALIGSGQRVSHLQVDPISGVPLQTSRTWTMKGDSGEILASGLMSRDQSEDLRVDTDIILGTQVQKLRNPVAQSKQ